MNWKQKVRISIIVGNTTFNKMKIKFLFFSCLLFLSSCSVNKTDQQKLSNTIEIGEYEFDFPADFNKVEMQGIDSYVGHIVGDSIKFYFDYGWYSNSLNEREQSMQYYVKKDSSNNIYSKILWPKESVVGITGIHVRRMPGTVEEKVQNSLTLTADSLNAQQQELAKRIFKTVRLKDKKKD